MGYGTPRIVSQIGALPRTNLPSERGTQMEDSTLGYLGQNALAGVGSLDAANQGV